MDVKLIARINVLWRPVYPFLAAWIARWCPPRPRWVLELGPFSGGIGEAMGPIFSDVGIVCLMPQDSVAEAVREQFGRRLVMMVGSLDALPFRDCFDLIVSRGAFFFLTPAIIREAHRCLKPGACAFLGGGYGPTTPQEEIQKIAEESKRLNYELGKKWLSRKDLEQMVRVCGLEGDSDIIEEGGLWLLMKKR